MRTKLVAALCFTLCTLGAQAAGSFDSDAEGWSSFGNGAVGPVWESSGGNPGGYISQLDSDNSWGYLAAPASYLAPIASGGQMSFSLRHEYNVGTLNYGVRVALVGGGLTLISEQAVPTTGWKNYVFTLDAAGGWRIHGDTQQPYNAANSAPTVAQFDAVLGSLTRVLVAADYTDYNTLTSASHVDRTQLDNFQLSAPVPEPTTWALMAMGLLLTVPVMRRAGLRQR